MIDCPVCKKSLLVDRVKCESCHVVFEGSFSLPRLARLDAEARSLAEQMILAGGNLKILAAEVGVSYPTLRRRVDDLIAKLADLKRKDEEKMSSILEFIEKGKITAEAGIRAIREIQGEI